MVMVTRFLRDTRGSMTQFGLVLTLLTLLAGGITVDVMRHEGTRSEVQKALDACTMNMAAVESPESDDEELATALNDCLTRAGLTSAVSTVSATTKTGTAGLASVSTTAKGTQTNHFMQMLSKKTMDYNGSSAAELAGGVEVVLAYEASNAMGTVTTGSLAANFKIAAKGFVDSLMVTTTASATGTRPATSVGLLPYSDGVNLPLALADRYNRTAVANMAGANCIDAPASDFNTAALPTTTPYAPLLTFDPIGITARTAAMNATRTQWIMPYVASNNTGNATVATSSANCPPFAGQVATVPTNDAATLKTAIDATQFFSGLRWDLGMNWASALLHPSTNTAIGTLLPENINTRPLSYNTPNVQKVIVFVNRSSTGSQTNGDHFVLNPNFATGLSPIYRNSIVSPATYCIHLPNRGTATSAKYFQPAITTTTPSAWTTSCPAGFVQQTWPEVWSQLRMAWVAWQLYARGMQTSGVLPITLGAAHTNYINQMNTTYTSTVAQFRSTVTFETQRTQFEAECAAAKANGVVIYTVQLDTTVTDQATRARGPLQACATSPSHYYTASAANIGDVLKTIAQTINQQAYSQ